MTQKALNFLQDLTDNNNRDWFQANKARYEADLKKPFEQFITKLIQEIHKTDKRVIIEPKKAIFRINRDTRFSKDKSPYKTNVGALISAGNTKEAPGLYVHLEPGMFMLGGGAYFLEKEELQKVRHFIMLNSEKFNDIIKNPDFISKYGDLQGEQNKKLPLEFQEAAQEQPLLYHKQFYAMAELDPQAALRADTVDFVMEYYHAIKPLNDFMIEALT
jgi:uncharacterized protein (TIGR02453 family)